MKVSKKFASALNDTVIKQDINTFINSAYNDSKCEIARATKDLNDIIHKAANIALKLRKVK